MRGGWVERGTVMIRLSRPHFAFFRGYLDNLDIGMLAQRYLETAVGTGDATRDLRLAKSAVTWIRDQLLVAARRAGHPKSARLLHLPAEKLHIEYDAATPSLDQYRETRDPYEIYSEDDLIGLFKEDYGASSARLERRAARNDRLRSRQRTALNQLEELVAADPKLTDRIDGWIDPHLAKRLQDAGMTTLSDLIGAINTGGYRWYVKIPKIGEKAAAQIVRWLRLPDVANALGVSLNVRALVKPRDLPSRLLPATPLRTDIVPLESFLMPSDLDGSHGANRGERCLLSARDDLQAIHAWLGNCKPGGHTLRSYRKEAERFLLWSILEKRKPMSSLTVEDCRDYRDFLWHLGSTVEVAIDAPALPSSASAPGKDPRASASYARPKTVTVLEEERWHTRFRLPQSRWIGKRGTPRHSDQWRPFEGRLSPSSQSVALVTIQSMLEWLTRQQYLHGNPMAGVSRLTERAEAINVSRALSRAEWNAVRHHLDTLKRDDDTDPACRMRNDRYQRLRFILALAYCTGMRLSELAALRREQIKSFTRLEDGVTCWMAEITGKGDKKRQVQLNRSVLAEMNAYFVRRGYTSFAAAPPDAPVIAALPRYDAHKRPTPGTLDDPIKPIRLYKLLKEFFANAAGSVDAAAFPDMPARLERASTHWLRHTYATHALEGGMSLEVVRDLLGHASLDTTSIYVNAERDRSSREAEEFGPSI